MNDASLTTQYLHWALAAAHRVANPDCEKVIIEVDLKTLGTTTRFVKKGQAEAKREESFPNQSGRRHGPRCNVEGTG
jgi:hypothetical protein